GERLLEPGGVIDAVVEVEKDCRHRDGTERQHQEGGSEPPAGCLVFRNKAREEERCGEREGRADPEQADDERRVVRIGPVRDAKIGAEAYGQAPEQGSHERRARGWHRPAPPPPERRIDRGIIEDDRVAGQSRPVTAIKRWSGASKPKRRTAIIPAKRGFAPSGWNV